MDQEELDISDILYIAVVTLIIGYVTVILLRGILDMVSNALS